MRHLVLALAMLGGTGCKGTDTPAPATQTGSAVAPAPADAGTPGGPALELVRCAAALPAPYVARWDTVGTGRIGNRGGVGTGGGYGILRAKQGATTNERVQLGAVKVTGPLNKDIVRRVLRRSQARLAFCYEQRLVKQPSLGGSSRLTIQINPSGSVFEAHVEDRFDDELALCVKHMIAELSFPAASQPAGDAKTQVEVPLTFSFQRPGTTGTASVPATTPAEPTPWTPFAASPARAPASIAEVAAVNLRRELPMRKLAACFGPHTGALRSVMRLASDGKVIAARSGGIGVKEVEACASAALVGIAGPPVEVVSEVVCDFHRGPPAPWRVTPDAGYVVIDAAQPVVHQAGPADREQTFLVLVDRSTSADALSQILAATAGGAGTVIGLRLDAGAPLYVAATHGAGGIDPTTPVRVDTSGEPVRICGGLLDGVLPGPFAEADKLFAQAARRCTHKPCPAQLDIGMAGTHGAGELAALAGAARGAGFERIAFGSFSCPP